MILSQVTCSAFHKQIDKYRLFLKLAQTQLLHNNQSDTQEFDECTTSANQDWFIYSLNYLIWPENLRYSYLKHLQPHNWKTGSCRYK